MRRIDMDNNNREFHLKNGIVQKVIEHQKASDLVPVGVRIHIHLTQEHVEALFGKDISLRNAKS